MTSNKDQIKLIDKWIAALSSGKYQKCRGVLKVTGENGDCKFCALGVFADILGYEFDENGDMIDSEYDLCGYSVFQKHIPSLDFDNVWWVNDRIDDYGRDYFNVIKYLEKHKQTLL